MEKNYRKAKVTEEHKNESRKLKEIWLNTPDRLSQEAFGAQYNIGTQSVVTQFLNGLVPISMKAAMGFAKGLGINIEDFSPRLAKEAETYAEATLQDKTTDFLTIKMLNIDLSAGPGKHPPSIIEESGDLQFRRSFLSDIGVSLKNAAIVHVRGTSMEPTIHDGAITLLNRADKEPRQGFIYAFSQGGMLHVKRFFQENKTWVARSDNPDRDEHPDIIINGSEPCKILGRAIWMGTKL